MEKTNHVATLKYEGVDLISDVPVIQTNKINLKAIYGIMYIYNGTISGSLNIFKK